MERKKIESQKKIVCLHLSAHVLSNMVLHQAEVYEYQTCPSMFKGSYRLISAIIQSHTVQHRSDKHEHDYVIMTPSEEVRLQCKSIYKNTMSLVSMSHLRLYGHKQQSLVLH